MPQLSTIEDGVTPPRIHIPRSYNAAFDLLERNLRAGRAEQVAFIDDETRLSYRELDRRSSAWARALQRRGIEREQRILLCLLDTVAFPIAFLGAIKAGIVPVPVNTLLTASDYAYMLQDSRARLALVSPGHAPVFEGLLTQCPDLRELRVADRDGTHPRSWAPLLEEAAEEAAAFTVAETHCDETCFWLYSSGSTGAPKGTIHRHASLIQTAELYARPILGITAEDRCFSAAKLFFAYGLGNALTFPMAVGATSILMAERPTPAAVFAHIARHRPTIFGGVPTLYASMLASPDLASCPVGILRRCTSAGEPLPEEIGRRWSKHFGVDILDGIGSTEMLHIFLSNRPDGVRYGTTGQAVPGYEVRLVDEQGAPVARGEPGELQICGPTSASGYWNNGERTRSTFLGPWTRSGDKFFEREDGYFVHAGRTDDMLKVSGIYVSPIEVESVLVSHESVLEAAVVARADQDQLIKPMAFVVLKPGITGNDELRSTLRAHVKARLAPYKYPRWIEFVTDLPKTATGKIQRFKLREQAASLSSSAAARA